MILREKNHQRISDEKYEQVLNKHDPFDRLILSLAKTGVLDVTIVGISSRNKNYSTHEYSQKSLSHRGKHTS